MWIVRIATVGARCLLLAMSLWASPLSAFADDWPQWLGPPRDGIWRETGILKSFPAGGPPVRWRTEIGAGYSAPLVAGGRVYLTDRPSARSKGTPAGPLDRTAVPGVERVLCLNEKDGKILWQHEYDCSYNLSYPSGPRASPAAAGSRVVTLGAEGNLLCLDGETGAVIWSHELKKDYGVETQKRAT